MKSPNIAPKSAWLMRCPWLSGGLILLFSLHGVCAGDEPEIAGFTAGLARVKLSDDAGYMLYLNSHYAFVNAGVDYKSLPDRTLTTACVGVGLGSLFQIQLGKGAVGKLARLRLDINLGEGVTLALGKEDYYDSPEYDNVYFGLGVLW